MGGQEEGEVPEIELLVLGRRRSSSLSAEDTRAAGRRRKAAAAAAVANEARERRRRGRRKDVYAYFLMPLVRALEAQTITTAWLRKVFLCFCVFVCLCCVLFWGGGG